MREASSQLSAVSVAVVTAEVAEVGLAFAAPGSENKKAGIHQNFVAETTSSADSALVEVFQKMRR